MKPSQLHFLITAGGTREYIDAVRFISNASSGKMGIALADAALKAGHRVTLITVAENSKLKTQNSKLKVVQVISADEMFKAVRKYFSRCDCLIMAAAVADYTPARKSKVKIKKSKGELIIKLKPTPDILKWATKNKKKDQVVVGFALEDRNLRKNAEKKLKEKNLDMIIANAPSAIGMEKSKMEIKPANGKWIKLADAPKTKSAEMILEHIRRCFYS